ncbi:MAG TPA: S41 family peptidase [Flavobacteriales bacterium]|nr:S41 family peptidase [Flavobacteriales bacterium]
MSMLRSIISVFLLLPLFVFPQGEVPVTERWQCQLTFGTEFGPVDTYLDLEWTDATHFSGRSPKNADRRVFGFTKSKLARMMKKLPKKGKLLALSDGRFQRIGDVDSVFATLTMPMLGKSEVRAVERAAVITGGLFRNGVRTGSITMAKSDLFQRNNYVALYAAMRTTIEKNIYDQALLKTKEWETFDKKFTTIAKRVQDDVEFFFGFSVLSQGLPFSHLNLLLLEETPSLAADASERHVFLKAIDATTLYMDVLSFGGSAQEMQGICDTLLNGGYSTLIVDLRKNGGGGLDSALPFGECIATDTVDAGYFVTNSWASEASRPPAAAAFKELPIAQERTTEAFIETLKNSAGRHLVLYPRNDAFKGKVYILTSNRTASTCEPIVDALKRSGRATIVGENTAGAMLSATIFQVHGKYHLFLPIADYYNADLRRLDQVGVKPDIEVKADDALDHVLALPR